jgi:hypothetical protein
MKTSTAARLALNLLLAGMVAVLGFLTPSAHSNVVTDTNTSLNWSAASGKPVNVPKFNGEKGCSAKMFDGWKNVLVVNTDGKTMKMNFDKAWNVTHNDIWADDVWVIGYC